MEFDKSSIKRILIIKYASIGDLIMSTSAFRALRKAYPNARIALLVGRRSLPVVKNNPNIDEFIVIDENIFAKRKITDALKLALRLRKRRFDVVVSFHRSKSMSLFSSLVGGKWTVGFDRGGSGRFYNVKVAYDAVKSLREAEKFVELVKRIGGKDESIRYDFHYTDGERKRVEKFVISKLKKKPFVVFVPGGGENPAVAFINKRWPIANWIMLGELLKKKQLKAVLIGSRSDMRICNEVASGIGGSDVVNLCGKLSIRDAAVLLRYSKAVVTPDTSIMHLSSAVSAETIALFGPTDPRMYAPLNVTVVKSDIKCMPCWEEGRFPKCDDNRCMKAIGPEEVYNLIIER